MVRLEIGIVKILMFDFHSFHPPMEYFLMLEKKKPPLTISFNHHPSLFFEQHTIPFGQNIGIDKNHSNSHENNHSKEISHTSKLFMDDASEFSHPRRLNID